MAIINSARELDVYKLAYKLALLNGMIKRTGELAMGRAGDGENWRAGDGTMGRMLNDKTDKINYANNKFSKRIRCL